MAVDLFTPPSIIENFSNIVQLVIYVETRQLVKNVEIRKSVSYLTPVNGQSLPVLMAATLDNKTPP
jgi:hypothetical protein